VEFHEARGEAGGFGEAKGLGLEACVGFTENPAFLNHARKMFFFEKKNQKTFVRLSRTVQEAPATAAQKFFASFFQKRRLFLLDFQPKNADFAAARH
jgi:hypothetical protein